MRRSTNVMITTLVVVCVVTLAAVTVALIRYDGEGKQEHGEKHGEVRTAPNPALQHNSASRQQPSLVKPDTHDLAHKK